MINISWHENKSQSKYDIAKATYKSMAKAQALSSQSKSSGVYYKSCNDLLAWIKIHVIQLENIWNVCTYIN